MKLNKTWDEWVKRYNEKFKDPEKYFWDSEGVMVAMVDLINSFGITDEDSEEFKLACVACSIIKWNSEDRLPENWCGLCTYTFSRALCLAYPCDEYPSGCGILYDVFEDVDEETLSELCQPHLQYDHADLILKGLYRYYKREYEKFMKAQGVK